MCFYSIFYAVIVSAWAEYLWPLHSCGSARLFTHWDNSQLHPRKKGIEWFPVYIHHLSVLGLSIIISTSPSSLTKSRYFGPNTPEVSIATSVKQCRELRLVYLAIIRGCGVFQAQFFADVHPVKLARQLQFRLLRPCTDLDWDHSLFLPSERDYSKLLIRELFRAWRISRNHTNVSKYSRATAHVLIIILLKYHQPRV